MQQNIDDNAIKAALDGNWEQAIELNHSILKEKPENIPALNRLAKAYSQLGKTAQAIETYEKVLTIDKFNAIAIKNCQMLKKAPCHATTNAGIIFTDFIEEPGKTKTISLVRLGDSKLLTSLQPGQEVFLVVKKHWIIATSQDGAHIGALPDNVSFHLKQLLAGGNTFKAVIRNVSSNQLSIFIRETHRAPEYANSPSFL